MKSVWLQNKKEAGKAKSSWLSKQARVNDCWIFHTRTKKWYTPDEFDEAGIDLSARNGRDEVSVEYKIMSPQYGIEQRLRFIKKVMDEFYEFKKRVDDFYITELKKK